MPYTIHFVNQNKIIRMEGGTLAEACDKAGYALDLVCGGKGTCKKCTVTVRRDGKMQQVKACLTPVDRDEEIYLRQEQYIHEGSVLTKSDRATAGFWPAVTKRYRTKAELLPDHGGAFFGGVSQIGVSQSGISNNGESQSGGGMVALTKGSLPALKKFAAISAAVDFSGCTLVCYKDELLDVQEGDTAAKLYGAAVDIGTTTVVCYVYDLTTGGLLATKSALNQQIVHGADVITRNSFAQESPDNPAQLQCLILETINGMLAKVYEEHPEVKGQLYHITLCGNSTMQHLFYGMNPANLGVSPFASITADPIVTRIKETGLAGAPEGIAEFLPLLGGFVGADTAAVLLTLPEDDKTYLMVDLGTNGEIAVGGQGGFLVASTACGPALEGGNIACGMRAAEGAIERVSISEDHVDCRVIGDVPPRGLCGSAVIDTVAQLRRIGLIDESGRLLDAEAYEAAHPGSALCRRLRDVEPFNPGFYFTEGAHPVYLCQQDIRQVQLAKSAICSGCMTLLSEYGIGADEVDALVLAGAFGNYIDIDNALQIGLLPPVPRERIRSMGNGAGQGVQMLLLDDSSREKLRNIPGHCTHIELADHPDFMEMYIMNMNFI